MTTITPTAPVATPRVTVEPDAGRPEPVICPIPPHHAFINELTTAANHVRTAGSDLGTGAPRGAQHVVDPVMPAVAHARLAVQSLDGALKLASFGRDDLPLNEISRAALSATSKARADVITSVELLTTRQGTGDFRPVLGKFDSALNWINTAVNLVNDQA